MSNLILEKLQNIQNKLDKLIPEDKMSEIKEIFQRVENWMKDAKSNSMFPVHLSERVNPIQYLQNDLSTLIEFKNEIDREIKRISNNIFSIISLCKDNDGGMDDYLSHIKSEVQNATYFLGTGNDDIPSVLERLVHIEDVKLQIIDGVRNSMNMVMEIKGFVGDLVSHMQTAADYQSSEPLRSPQGEKVFIGHGGKSEQWRALKDFIEDTLRLSTDEFNRVQVAGFTVTQRLEQMLNNAALAFLIMTGEDEVTPKEGEDSSEILRARENVVYEAGLFQGRLGMTKAIILLEEGCGTFTNIDGVQVILFPKGNIRGAFEDIREVCKREGLIPERSS